MVQKEEDLELERLSEGEGGGEGGGGGQKGEENAGQRRFRQTLITGRRRVFQNRIRGRDESESRYRDV